MTMRDCLTRLKDGRTTGFLQERIEANKVLKCKRGVGVSGTSFILHGNPNPDTGRMGTLAPTRPYKESGSLHIRKCEIDKIGYSLCKVVIFGSMRPCKRPLTDKDP